MYILLVCDTVSDRPKVVLTKKGKMLFAWRCVPYSTLCEVVIEIHLIYADGHLQCIPRLGVP